MYLQRNIKERYIYKALETQLNKWLKLKYVKYNSRKIIYDLVHAF